MAGRTGEAARNAGCMVDLRFVCSRSGCLLFLSLFCWNAESEMRLYYLRGRMALFIKCFGKKVYDIDTGTGLCPEQEESDCGEWIKSLAVSTTPQKQIQRPSMAGLENQGRQAAL